jgi:cytochrome c-type biogenesis protein
VPLAAADTTVLAAFAVGFISFISPCVLPLVPGYLSAISGPARSG